MIKKQYLKELVISGPCARNLTTNKKADVLKIQSWLNLFAQTKPSAGTSTGIDADFGPATELAVRHFQKAKGLTESGK